MLLRHAWQNTKIISHDQNNLRKTIILEKHANTHKKTETQNIITKLFIPSCNSLNITMSDLPDTMPKGSRPRGYNIAL